MVKNIIFDMGNVLVTYDPKGVCLKYFNEEDYELVLKTVFQSKEWLKLDKGTIEENQAFEIMLASLPKRLHKQTEKMFKEWHQYLTPKKEMLEVVKQLKNNGYHLYLCSNVGVRYEQFYKNIEALSLMDGHVLSSKIKHNKPEKEIYEYLFKTYDLKPNECFFIDDYKDNILMGKTFGMDGYIFNDDITLLKEYMRKIGIKLD